MSWTTLLAENNPNEKHSLPWVGGRVVQLGPRRWHIEGRIPREHGWYLFEADGRKMHWHGCRAEPHDLQHRVVGYLVGDRIAPDDGSPAEKVFLIEPGLDRFARISAGRAFEGGPLIFQQQEMPLGPEEEVLNYFLDGKNEMTTFTGATPALYAALRLEIHHRVETERRRAELERLRREEEERLTKERQRRELIEKLGDGEGRRQMARVDFREAAKAALAVGGAELLDVRNGQRGEKVIKYRLDGARYECVCDERLQIVDSGICLTAHDDDQGFEEGTKGDGFFTLESLPAVVRQAQRERRLVVYRHG